MAQFAIGPFDFINLSRPPGVPMEQLARQTQPGADGVTFFKTGKRSEPFQLISSRDYVDVGDAAATVTTYQELAGQGVVSLWWAGRYYGGVIVHNVQPLEDQVFAVLLGIGGILGTSRAKARCVWVLEYVPVQQQAGDSE